MLILLWSLCRFQAFVVSYPRISANEKSLTSALGIFDSELCESGVIVFGFTVVLRVPRRPCQRLGLVLTLDIIHGLLNG